MIKTLLKFIVSGCMLILPALSHAQVGAVTGDLGTACSATGAVMAADGACTFTPTTYKIQIFEMGLCTAHPFGPARDLVTFDRTNCVTTYLDGAPAQVDIASSLGGAPIALTGTSSAPAENTYSHAYMIMDDTFIVSGSFVDGGGDTHVSETGGTADTLANGATLGEATNNLGNFGDNPNCDSGFHDAPISGGTMDAYVTDDTLTRSVRAGQAGDVGGTSTCALNGRLTGVMSLATPVVVTSNTVSVVFNFDLTNQGVQFFDDAGSDQVPDQFGSGPFSGSFTVINN